MDVLEARLADYIGCTSVSIFLMENDIPEYRVAAEWADGTAHAVLVGMDPDEYGDRTKAAALNEAVEGLSYWKRMKTCEDRTAAILEAIRSV